MWEALYGERPFLADTLEELALEVTQGKLREPPKTSNAPRKLRVALERGLSTAAADRFESMSALIDELRNARRRPPRGAAIALAAIVAGAAGGAVYWQMSAGSDACTSASDHLVGVWDDGRKAEVRAAFTGVDKPFAEATWTGVERVLDRYAGEWIDGHTDACRATHTRKEQSDDLMDLRMACLDERRQRLDATTDIFADADADVVQSALTAVYQLPDIDACSDLQALTAGLALPEGDALRAEVAGIRARLGAARATADTGDSIAAQASLVALATEIETVEYPPARAEVLAALGSLQDANGDAEAAEQTLKRAILLAESAGYDRITVDAQIDLAWVVGYTSARYEAGIDLLDRADAILERLRGAESAAMSALNTRGAIFQEQGKLPEALALYEAVKVKRERALGPDHPQVAAILINIGNLYLRQGKYAEALDQYERSLAIYRAVFGDDHPDLFGAHYSKGHALLYQARYGEALESYGRALALREAALGPDNPNLAGVLNNMGVAHEYRGELEEAYVLYSRSLELKRAQNPDHPSVANSEANLGSLMSSLGRYDEALAHHERALAIRTAKHSEPHADVANSLDRTGSVYRSMGRLDEAMDYHKRARETYVAALGADHPEVAVTLLNIGRVHSARGEHAKALAVFRESASIRASKLGEDHPNTHASRTAMGRALVELNRPGEAVEVLEATRTQLLATNADQSVLVDTEFSLARALWRSGGDRARARTVAESARDRAASLGNAGSANLAAIEGWLARPR
jgi:tetratricopeptide (TPR) repeat protein